jgi:uncharacterized HAD superfamily protein
MKKPIIAVDIDDVLFDENMAVLRFVNEQYGLSLTAEDYDIDAPYWGYWEKVWKVSDDEGAKRYEAYIASGVKLNHHVMSGAVESIKRLKKQYRLVIITARDDRQVELTHAWLDKHFPGVFDEIAFVHVWSGDIKASKAVIASKLEVSYLIDDNAEHCKLAAEAGIEAILFGDYGWNRSVELVDGVTRARNWQEVTEYFNGR